MVDATIGGRDFGEAFKSNPVGAAVDVLGAEVAQKIGGAYQEAKGNGIDPLEYGLHKAFHAALGCGMAAAQGADCGAGAVGGAAGAVFTEAFYSPSDKALELSAEVQAGRLTPDQMRSRLAEWQAQGVDMARLASGLAAFASGAEASGVTAAASIGGNVAENNVLETVWDLASLAMSIHELKGAIKDGDVLDVLLAGGAVVVDGAAVVIPGVPGGAGVTLKMVERGGRPAVELVTDAARVADDGAGFYNPQAWRKYYEDFYDGVSSATVPPFGKPNVKLAGQKHPFTGVVFDVRGFPIFDDVAKYDTRLPIDAFKGASAQTQMRMATRDLAETLQNSPTLRAQFKPDQLRAIDAGSPNIPRLTWHHHQDTGRMQLVPAHTHQKTGHVGGQAISGGR